MFIEIIPREVANIMREPIEHAADDCRLVNDSIGYESLYDAIIDAERICASIELYVIPENLLFIFGQTVQSLGYARFEFPYGKISPNHGQCLGENMSNKERTGGHEYNPDGRSIVMCKLKNSEDLKILIPYKKHESAHHTDCYEVTWGELQEIKKVL